LKIQGQDAAKEIFIYSVLESVRRHKYLLLIPILIFVAAAIFYSYWVTPVYRSEALLRAEPMVTVRDFVDATGASHASRALNIDENFRNIQELVLSEEVLAIVIEEFGLYSLVNGRVPEAALQDMKKRVRIRIDVGDGPRDNEPRVMSFRVGFEGKDREQIVNVANRLANLFIKKASDARERRVQGIVGFIQDEMTPLQRKLEAQNEGIKRYKQGAPDSLPEQATSNLRFLEGLQTQYLTKAESISKDEARRAAIMMELQELEKQGALETVTPVADKSEIERKLDDLRIQYSQMQARYAPDHPVLRQVKKEISEVEPLVPQQSAKPRTEHSPFYLRHVQLKSEVEELDRRAQSYKREQQDLVRQIATYRSRVESAPARESELAVLARDYTATQAQYQEMLERQHNARLAEHFEKLSSEVIFRVVDPAQLSSRPVGPQPRHILLLGILGGLGLGVVLIFFAEQMDSSFSSVDDYQRACDIPILATVPSIGHGLFKRRHLNGGTADPAIAMLRDPESIPAEQYRILATKMQSRNGKPSHVIAVTSATGGEGKTLTAINLAVALSGRPDRKVLLIDADLRRPRVQGLLGQRSRQEKGFADLLSDPGDGDPDSYILKIGELYFIPGAARCANPVNLLSSRRAREVLQKLRAKFSFIILDTPAALPMADGIILSSLADEVFVVLRARKTPRELFQHAIENLETANIRGVVFNDVDVQHSRYAHAYRYYRKNYAG
jgi:polysaccharide chain length determinant protein (PEP-CTERM system associated)